MASEFDLIKKYFARTAKHTDLGVGDDAALLRVADGMQLVVSTDMIVSGTHFFSDAAPYDIGWKALAVNVSDMAAMGAQPKWATLALALPEANESWTAEFARGFFTCADAFNIDLIGGDTTRGSLNICVTIFGEVPHNQALRRDGANAGDDIWVSGYLGSAAAGLAQLQGKLGLKGDALQISLSALHRPIPRVTLGLALRGIASACLDISDGLAQDLGHILAQSTLGADVFIAQIPTQPALTPALQANKDAGVAQYALSGGDDYELCFTAPPNKREAIEKISTDLNLPLTRIGQTSAQAGLRVYDAAHNIMPLTKTGYDHFA